MPQDLTAYRITVRRGSLVERAPTASVIALVTDDTAMLVRCLHSLDAASAGRPHEVVVLANGTPPAALAALTGREDIVLVQSPVNLGFPGGCNLAARFARANRLVFVNDDAVTSAGWLDGLHGALDADPAVAVVGSKVVLGDGRLQEAGAVLWRDGSTSGVGRGCDPSLPEFQRRRHVDYVSFCSAMVRRVAWEQAGGFDERYFPAYYEDLDLCLGLRGAGWTVVYEPTSVVHHAEGASASRHFRDFLSRRNQRMFVAKWGALLDEYEAPPAREADRPAAVQHALRRAARRASPTTAPALPEPAQMRSVPAGLEDMEALIMELAHLSAAVAVQEEYAGALREELATRGLLDVVKHKLYPRRLQVGRYVRSLRTGLRNVPR